MARLTLNLEAEVIERARRLAAERHTRVSTMFSQFIRALANRRGRSRSLGKLARQASGVIGLKGYSHEDVLADALKDKYRL